jgi:hypothetical protein
MSKQSRYHDSNYCLTFGDDDVIFIDMVLLITRTPQSDGRDKFDAVIERAQLNPAKMEFAFFLASMLDADSLRKLKDRIHEILVQEINENLFNYFYAGTILNEEPQS